MRANAPSFTPSATMGASNPLDLDQDSLSDSLLKALVNEKERHRAARLALEAAQAQITSLSNENKTLKASKILLEAVVKKNRTQQPDSTLAVRVPSSEEAQDTINNSILYDALAQQREIYETKGYPEDKKQDDRLFDLSLVSASSREDAIFRHFLDEETMKDSSQASAPPRQDTGKFGTKLVEITTPTQNSPSKSLPTVTEAVESCNRALKSALTMSQPKENLENRPILQLPADFLAKYRPAKKTPVVAEDSEIPFTTESRKEALLLPIKTEAVMKSVLPNAVRVPVLDTKIKWVMNSLVPAFDNEDQIQQAKQSLTQFGRSRNLLVKSGNNHASYFWQHPVRFLPNPTEKNLYRTVMIDYIPRNTTYQDVLEYVRTGSLESIQLFPPIRGCTDFFTARVVFTYEIPAVSMVMQYQKRMNQGDPIKINGCVVRFWQVLQPTYPANKELEDDMFQNGYTRILLLENVENSGVLPKLHEKLDREMREGSVIKINRTDDGVPMVEFTSVAAAAGALRRLQGDREFKGCIFDFDRDYCENGYESE